MDYGDSALWWITVDYGDSALWDYGDRDYGDSALFYFAFRLGLRFRGRRV